MKIKLNGEMVYLWSAIDREGEILESYITKIRDIAATLRFKENALKRHNHFNHERHLVTRDIYGKQRAE